MTRKQALTDLHDKVAAGELTRTSAEELVAAIFGLNQVALDFGGAYAQGSLDAALAFHNAVLPPINQYTIDEGPSGCGCHLVIWPDGLSDGRELKFKTMAETPSQAWLLAILSALIAECGE